MGSLSKGIDYTIYTGSKNGKIVQTTRHHDGLRGEDVLVKVTHSGLCGTDLHLTHSDLCLGHECAGVVQELGPDAKAFKIGDKVGFGFQHSACGTCQQCLTGKETYCPQRIMYGYGNFDTGSMASHAIFRASFLYHIPRDMTSEDAAPLMCGGATVFNIFDMYKIPPTSRVGIIGVGGLGHLAIQFAAKWGCEVIVFSGTESKKEEAVKLGAKEFYATKGVEKLDIGKPIDHLLVTSSTQVPWDLYLPILAPASTVYPLSVVDEGDLKVPYMPFLIAGITVQFSIIAPRAIHTRMLNFAAFHGIRPIIQKYKLDLDGIEEAMKDLVAGKMRYRGVLCAE